MASVNAGSSTHREVHRDFRKPSSTPIRLARAVNSWSNRRGEPFHLRPERPRDRNRLGDALQPFT